MTLWWIGDIVLLLVVVPVVDLPAQRRADEAPRHRPERRPDRAPPRRAARRTSTPSPLLLTTQDQVIKTVENVADYGGSLDVILDDASEE